MTSARRGTKRDMIRDAVTRLPNRFWYADLERALPAISRPTSARALRQLRAEGLIRCLKPGRDATWEKAWHLHESAVDDMLTTSHTREWR